MPALSPAISAKPPTGGSYLTVTHSVCLFRN
jgi:hypothetical protein